MPIEFPKPPEIHVDPPPDPLQTAADAVKDAVNDASQAAGQDTVSPSAKRRSRGSPTAIPTW